MNKPAVVIISLTRWDGPYSSTSVSLAKEFSKEARVVYTNNPRTWNDLWSVLKNPEKRKYFWEYFTLGRFKNNPANANVIVVDPPVTLPINFLSKGKLYNMLLSVNRKIVAKYIKKVLKKTGISDYVLINSFNPFYYHGNILRPRVFVYHSVDDIKNSAYISKHGTWMEPEVIKKADFTIVTSLKLKESCQAYTENVYYLPNAADFDLFFKGAREKPGLLNGINSDIILYTGHMDSRVDLDLLESIALSNKDRTVLIVGLVSLNKKSKKRLDDCGNVKFIGQQPLTSLPAFLYSSACGIIPFKKNELTASIYPLKVNEYLATGLPVVSTAFSEDIEQFYPTISIADEPRSFNACIDGEILNDSQEKKIARQEKAKQNTWASRAATFWTILDQYL